MFSSPTSSSGKAHEMVLWNILVLLLPLVPCVVTQYTINLNGPWVVVNKNNSKSMVYVLTFLSYTGLHINIQYKSMRIYQNLAFFFFKTSITYYMDRVKRIWYLSPMRAAKVQASLRIRAVSPEPSLLAHTSSESRRTFRQKARSLAPLNGWACAVKICHDGMLEDTNSLDGAQLYCNYCAPQQKGL